MRTTRIAFRVTTPLAVLLAFCAIGPAPGAGAVTVDIADFTGDFATFCGTLPYEGMRPVSGPYACDHMAWSTVCASTVDATKADAHVYGCSVELGPAHTAGGASATDLFAAAVFRCDYGSGSGSAVYRPADGGPGVPFPTVVLEVANGVITIDGSAVQASTGRLLVLHATMPAVCQRSTAATGFQGTVTVT